VVVGAGPNGLAAAVTLAREGLAVLVLEAEDAIGGGCRSEALTLPGFLHDVCSAVHPMGLSSPALRAMGLEGFGLEWVHPEVPLAHPLDGGEAAVVTRDLAETAEGLGEDGPAYRRLLAPFVERWGDVVDNVLSPPVGFPPHPLLHARFGLLALRSATGLAAARFRGRRARALWTGMAAHGCLPLERAPTASFGLLLGASGSAVGWPLARGGSRSIAEAMAACLRSLGGSVETGARVASPGDLPEASAVLFDVSPGQLLAIAGERLPARARRAFRRFRHGPGVFKIDWALSDPIPWEAEPCRRAGTLHLGGTMEEIASAERRLWEGRVSEAPYVIVVQPSLFDPDRAPAGKHVAWGYCHVPSRWEGDRTAAVEAQLERFAPGFRDCVLARSTLGPAALEAHNANNVGGDISGGVQDLRQTFARPTLGPRPYATGVPGWYLCSASTPPGGGVHGMCGHHAARLALREVWGVGSPR
jgi:phytoene dehydrogenase-like protein